MGFTNWFEILLSLAVLVTGSCWLSCRFKRGPYEKLKNSAAYFPVLFFVLLIRTFVFQPFHVISGSLEPSILIGDVLAVNQSAYGLFLPILHTKILNTGKPARGDIVLFYYPDDPSQVYVKRIIGLPGDHIQYQNKQLIINNKLIPHTLSGYGLDEEPQQAPMLVEQYEENLMGIRHSIYINPRIDLYDNIDITVPKDEYFMMGDNRDDSDGSRRWGSVPQHNLIGRAYRVLRSVGSHWYQLRWRRFGMSLQG